jgi:hypothetical protein
MPPGSDSEDRSGKTEELSTVNIYIYRCHRSELIVENWPRETEKMMKR